MRYVLVLMHNDACEADVVLPEIYHDNFQAMEEIEKVEQMLIHDVTDDENVLQHMTENTKVCEYYSVQIATIGRSK